MSDTFLSVARSLALPPARVSLEHGAPLLAPGARVSIYGVEWKLVQRATTGRHVFRHEPTGTLQTLAWSRYCSLWNEENLRILNTDRPLPNCKARVIDVPYEAFPPATQRKIKRKLYYCMAMDRECRAGVLRARSKDDVAAWIMKQPLPPGWNCYPSRGQVMKDYALWIGSGKRESVLAHGNAMASTTLSRTI